MTRDATLAAALGALPLRPVDAGDRLALAFAGTVTGVALVAGLEGRTYFAVVRLEASQPIPPPRPGGRHGEPARRNGRARPMVARPSDDAA